MEDRNPSPPPEFEEESERPDAVGGTAISKHWVFTTLLDIIKEVENHSKREGDEPVDVDEDLQDSACKIWDLCMDQEFAVFLLDFEIIEILYGVIFKSKSPRLTEISVGILGNMVCSKRACREISKVNHLRSVVLALLASPDVQTLVETVRLLRQCLSTEDCQAEWIQSIVEDLEDFVQNSQFILNSSTNGKLLSSLSEVLDLLYEDNNDILTACCTEEFVGAMLEGAEQQMKASSSESLRNLCHTLHAMHSISESIEGRIVFSKLRRSIIALLASLCYQWITTHPSIDPTDSSTMSSSEVSVSCLLSITIIIFNMDAKSDSDDKRDVVEDEIDDEDRQLIIKFARFLSSSKCLISAIQTLSALASSEENENEFKTPLYNFKSSSRAGTPVLSQKNTLGDVTELGNETPVQTLEISKDSPAVWTPSRGETGNDTPITRESEGDDKFIEPTPSFILRDLANQLLQAVADPNWIVHGDSPKK